MGLSAECIDRCAKGAGTPNLIFENNEIPGRGKLLTGRNVDLHLLKCARGTLYAADRCWCVNTLIRKRRLAQSDLKWTRACSGPLTCS